MSETKLNTTKSIENDDLEPNVRREIEASLAKALKHFKGQKTVKVAIPKNYNKFLGDLVPFSINGVRIVIPVDGKKYDVPEGFKDNIDEFLANVRL